MSRDTFGIDPSKLSIEEIKREIAIHEETIRMNKVGTPNVYVRLATLQRALAAYENMDGTQS